MGARTTIIGLLGLLAAGCGGEPADEGGHDPPATAADGTTGDEASDGDAPPSEAEAELEAANPFLGQLREDRMLTYRVTRADQEAPAEVRLLVQQRIESAQSIAVRLVPIGTPLEEVPVFPQWVIGTPDSMGALDEAAQFTTPGFVPIDDQGQLRTEAVDNLSWRVEARWLRAGTPPAGEAALGWSLAERVGTIREPLRAEDCVRLERSDDVARMTLVVCAGIGIIRRVSSVEDEERERWELTAIGERPTQLE